MKTVKVYSVLYNLDRAPGPWDDGTDTARFHTLAEAEVFAKDKRYYAEAARVIVGDVPKRIAERWGM